MKTNELIGPALDWAAAICQSFSCNAAPSLVILGCYSPSTKWEQGGPIIEQARISVSDPQEGDDVGWTAMIRVPQKFWACGPTPLIAAMRCYVASELGEEIEIPKGL